MYLNWSDYQGDEIKAMYRPEVGQSMWNFLMEQRKGPLQFVITFILKYITPDYYNTLVMRLPFAIAGILAIFVFYKVIKMHFGTRVALYASLFLSLNGLMVAFSRMVQYQSFTIFLFMLALYYFSLALYNDKWRIKGWYIGMFYWGLSALAHYDAIFIAPFVLYILWQWFGKYKDISNKTKLIHILASSLVCALVVAAFYIPFVLSLTDSQFDYWSGRLTNNSVKISSSIYLFRLYNPIFLMYLYIGLATLGLFKLKKTWPLIIWFVFPFLFMEVITDVPGTHIYTYLIPVAIMMGFGLLVVEKLIIDLFGKKLGHKMFYLGISVYFLFSFTLTHTLFIDHVREYPWGNKQFLFWTIHKPEVRYHLSVFGFPYNRHWDEIQAYIRENGTPGYTYYGTNEKKSIPRFYMEDYDKEGSEAEYYIYVYKPQSFNESILQDKPYDWIRNHKRDPVLTFTDYGKDVVKLYKMPLGGIEALDI